MKRVKVIGLTSFSSAGISFYPGMEAEIDEVNAKNWIEAGFVKKVNDDIEDAQIVEKTSTAEEIERQNLETLAKQYGIEINDSLDNDAIEDLIHAEITKKKEARTASSENPNGTEENAQNADENKNDSANNEENKLETSEDVNTEENKVEDVKPKKGKKTEITAE